MEKWQSWAISSLVVVIGMVAKFLLEIYLPELKKKKINIKRTGINTLMTLFLLYLLGNVSVNIFGEPRYEHTQVFALFQVFLFISFVAFLVVMKIFRIFFDDVSKNDEANGQSASRKEANLLMQN
jgi:quinol-cytochrome oxidoreductase complex cytochrome b subunit